jgi:hypothetical protein
VLRYSNVPDMGHVYVTVQGYSKRVIPASSPCEFSLDVDGSVRVVTTGRKPFGLRLVAVDAAPDAAPGQDPTADIVSGPAEPEWWLDCRAYKVPLPPSWTAIASGGVMPVFNLVDDHGRLVFIQTARNRPNLNQMVARGQTALGSGSSDNADWVEVSYMHEGSPWRQRHALMRTNSPAMITAQAPEAVFAAARDLQTDFVRRAVFE